MKPTGKHIRILMLMIVSFLLLTSFVVYWIGGQFREEKNLLRKELKGVYNESVNSLIDSILIEYVIEPALIESRIDIVTQQKPHYQVTLKDSLAIGPGPTISTTPETGSKIVRMNVNSTSNDTIITKGNRRAFFFSGDDSIPGDQLLLRSIKLIVQRDRDSTGIFSFTTPGNLLKGDTVLFRNDFNNRLADSKMPFHTTFIGDSADIPAYGKGAIYLQSQMKGIAPSVIISGYGTYVISEIFPQLLFGFILLLLTGLSFVISYRNIRRQVMLNDIRNSFVSNITHELKTPVSTVKVALEAIGNYNIRNDRAKTDEYLNVATAEVSRLQQLITRVLDHALLEEGSEGISMELVDMGALVTDLLSSMRARFEKFNATVEWTRPPVSMQVEGDPLYLQGVIINLIDNSLKYSGDDPVIEIEISEEGPDAILVVRDWGPGIAPEYLHRVFDKFFRVPANDTHNVKGYGLGLSYASMVMKLHRGTVSVKNLDKGTMFTITIPRKVN